MHGFTAVGMVLFGLLFATSASGRNVAEPRRTTPSLDIKVNGQGGVISVISIDAAYPELCAWLEQRAPTQWNEFVRVFGR